MGLMGYINFVLLFVREGENAVGMDPSNQFYLRATTLTYVTIVFTQWLNIISIRAGVRESAISKYIFANKQLLIGYLISFILVLNISYNPYVSSYLRTAPLTISDWIFAVLGALVFFSIREGYKVFLRKKHKQATQKA